MKDQFTLAYDLGKGLRTLAQEAETLCTSSSSVEEVFLSTYGQRVQALMDAYRAGREIHHLAQAVAQAVGAGHRWEGDGRWFLYQNHQHGSLEQDDGLWTLVWEDVTLFSQRTSQEVKKILPLLG